MVSICQADVPWTERVEVAGKVDLTSLRFPRKVFNQVIEQNLPSFISKNEPVFPE